MKSLFQAPYSLFLLFFALLLLSALPVRAQSKYWVFFKDKPEKQFDARQYFSPRGYERRVKRNLPLGDYYDLPVASRYTGEVMALADSFYARSRWLNAIVVSAGSTSLDQIAGLPFVKGIEPVRTLQLARKTEDSLRIFRIKKNDSLLLRFQLHRMKGEVFKKEKLDGKGITIAVFDVGFRNADIHPAFQHLFQRGAIRATYDFIGDDPKVYDRGSHGTMVLGCLAGVYDSIPMGLATGADFLLARTERAHLEITFEEYSWIAAAEWADRHGADIISSSLGYSDVRYFQEEMDGRVAPISRAANIAASRGILVINAAGNEAGNSWGTIVAPGDADSVLTVGGVDPRTDAAIAFSSAGPAADGTPKPNVVNLGIAFTSFPRKFGTAEGTSFATPLTAGFAACAWQANPGKSNMEIFHMIESSGHLFPYFDYHHGYGIPQADKVLGLAAKTAPTFHFDLSDAYLEVKINEEFVPEKDEDGKLLSHPGNLYYKIVKANGKIRKYGVVLAEMDEPVYFERDDLKKGEKVVVHFEGYTESYIIDEEL